MSLLPGTTLGPYEIAAAIGAGGMGEVYRARDTRLDRCVAIKGLARHLAGDPVARERLRREALAAASLESPVRLPDLRAPRDGRCHVHRHGVRRRRHAAPAPE
jgi:serine/threonine protein kinase